MALLVRCGHCKQVNSIRHGFRWRRTEMRCTLCGCINLLERQKGNIVKVTPKETPDEYKSKGVSAKRTQ